MASVKHLTEVGWYENDCTVCALSTWARVPYDVAHDAIWPDHHPKDHAAYYRQLYAGMERLGFGPQRMRRCRSWVQVPPGSITLVRFERRGKQYQHAVVKMLDGTIRDCDKPFSRTPSRSYKVAGYIEQKAGTK